MKAKTAVFSALASSAILAMGVVATGTAQAAPHPQARLTWARMNAMTPDQVAALQKPLMATADPISSVGAGQMANLFSSVSLDTPDHTVDVYVTNLRKAGQLLRAAAKNDPGLNLSQIRVMKSRYSLATLNRAADRLIRASIARRTPFKIYVANQVGNGQGLQLQVADAPRARSLSTGRVAGLGGQSVRQFAGVALTFATGTPMAGLSREDDSAPFIGGDWLYGWNTPDKGRVSCTAGIPVESTSGQDGLITAGHCFTPDNGVYTENFGASVGTSSSVSDTNDSEIVWTGKYLGGGSNADEGESDTAGNGIKYFPLVKTVGWASKEYVCQDGMQSYENGRGVPCNISIIGNSTYSLCLSNGYCGPVNGVKTGSTNGKPVVIAGDSGAVVFTINTPASRNALGMVDTSEVGCGTDCVNMSFIPQGAIMAAFHVSLNPYQ
jgi:hypothetical protein